jgi:tRNA pseudouridine55 synthase
MTTRKNGILLVDKPAGVSSAGVVARVKRVLGANRVGHAGTLDPDATGLLIILINGATRVASYAADGFKVYSGDLQLGITTSTDDLSGEILSQDGAIPDFNRVQEVVGQLTGELMQIPPKVSAKKLDGKRAYKLHREGIDFELSARRVEVRRFEIKPTSSADTFSYLVEVSPGTYVRSLARDLGSSLGCGGAVKSIRREVSGHFSVLQSVPMDNVSWDEVRDWGELVPELPRIEFDERTVAGLLNGQLNALREASRVWKQVEGSAGHVIYSVGGRPGSLGILKVQPDGTLGFCLNVGSI